MRRRPYGRIRIDNNPVERGIRPTKLGMRNWLFIGHPSAGWALGGDLLDRRHLQADPRQSGSLLGLGIAEACCGDHQNCRWLTAARLRKTSARLKSPHDRLSDVCRCVNSVLAVTLTAGLLDQRP